MEHSGGEVANLWIIETRIFVDDRCLELELELGC
jgi:hypothetical protein